MANDAIATSRSVDILFVGEGKNRRLSFPLFFKVKIMAR